MIENRKCIILLIIANINKLIENQNLIFSQLGVKALNFKEFTYLMKEHGITHNDNEFLNKLFWVFDEDESGDIEYKEMAFGLEMFRESTFENKLKGKFKSF